MLSHTNADTTYALDPIKNRMVHVSDVSRGLACNCICPMCKNPMIANKGEHNQHYFSHERKAGNQFNAQLCQELTMHMLAEQILRDKKRVMLPNYYNVLQARQIKFEHIEVEERRDRSDIQPDIVGITADGKRYLIEIKFSHAVDDEKKRKIYSDDLTCLEIDISSQKMDDLEDFLLNKTYDRKWINNKYGFDSIVDTYKSMGHDVRVLSIDKCKSKYAPEECSYCVNSEIMHCGNRYIICSSVSECQYKERDAWKHIFDEVYKKPTREERDTQTYFTSRSSYVPAPTRTDIGNGTNYPCHPGNLLTTIDDYYNNISCNKIFYKKGDKEYSILNHWIDKKREKFGVILTSESEGSRFRYVIVSKPSDFKHEWSTVEYNSENTATFTLKKALGLE